MNRSLLRLGVQSQKIAKGRNYMFILHILKKARPAFIMGFVLPLTCTLAADIFWLIPRERMKVKYCFHSHHHACIFSAHSLKNEISLSLQLCWKVTRHWCHKSRENGTYSSVINLLHLLQIPRVFFQLLLRQMYTKLINILDAPFRNCVYVFSIFGLIHFLRRKFYSVNYFFVPKQFRASNDLLLNYLLNTIPYRKIDVCN